MRGSHRPLQHGIACWHGALIAKSLHCSEECSLLLKYALLVGALRVCRDAVLLVGALRVCRGVVLPVRHRTAC